MLKKFKALETGLACYALIWGMIVIMPPQTFKNPLYSAFLSIAPENIWGIFALVVGTIQLGSMLICNHLLLRKLFLLIAAGFWYFVFTAFMMSEPFSTGATYLVTAILTSYVFVKVGEQNGC
jgi:hypothetical protein